MAMSNRRTLLVSTLLIAAATLSPARARGQTFTEVPSAALQGIQLGSVSWADFDNDGDLDLLVVGRDATLTPTTHLYRSDGTGNFALVGAGFLGVEFSAAAWGDYDNDGDLDVIITGEDDFDVPISRLYRNDGGTFTSVAVGFQGIKNGAVAWGDFDNDGDLDLVLTGRHDAGSTLTRLYRNDGGAFVDIGGGLPALDNASAAWGDYDADGDLDLILVGLDVTSTPIARIYRNTGGVFTDASAGLVGIERGAVAWCDYDRDGDLDLTYCGAAASGSVTTIYRNDGFAGFVDSGVVLTGLTNGSIDWGDSDNDGDPDLLLTGTDKTSTRLALVVRNDGATFTTVAAGLDGVRNSGGRWADVDNDRDLDLVIAGQNTIGTPISKLYRNGSGIANTAPGAPSGLSASLVGNTVTLSWAPASDAQTAAAGLSYNIRLGLTSNGAQVVSPQSDPATGFRRIVHQGNVTGRTSWTLQLPTLGSYFWSVQTIDAAHAGSVFASERTFATAFTDWSSAVSGVYNSAVAWGDFDGDGDLDVVLTGMSATGRLTRLYRNSSGVFADTGYSFQNVDQGAVAWGDFDNDGDLDLVVTGFTNGGRTSRIYRNTGGGFTDIGASLEPVYNSAVAWGDYDNDGDLDLLLAGSSDCCGRITRIYRNTAGTFNDMGVGFNGLEYAAVAWGDYDNDGDLDVIATGASNCCSRICQVYRNNGGSSFTDISASIQGVQQGSVAWGDYDSDGDLDALIAGLSDSGRLTRVYVNAGGFFFNSGATFEGIEQGAAAFADTDNDGDLDVAVTGMSNVGRITRVYQNSAGVFADTIAGLEGFDKGTLAWGDFDGDLDADLILTGQDGASASRVRLYKNNASSPNTVPAAPGGLTATTNGMSVTLNWLATTDAQTNSNALQYNVRVGTTPGGSQVFSAMAAAGTGTRFITQRGNVDLRRTWTLQLPQLGTYYWTVQAVDAGLAASSFANEQTFSTPFGEGPVIEGVYQSSAAWGDYDNDGDLDLLIAGLSNNFGTITRLYRNTSGSFADVGAGLPGVQYGSVAWGDYDSDGDLDIAVCGSSNCCGLITRIYRNNPDHSFTDIGAVLEGVQWGALAWGDCDNDGDLDLIVTGYASCCSGIARIYRNTAGLFSEVSGTGLQGNYYSAVVWADLDNDRDLDLVISGAQAQTRVYKNNGNSNFADMNANLVPTYRGGLSCGDYDNDGDLDILLTGQGHYARIYRNNAGSSFTDIGANLEPVYNSSCAWGDYDNDGDLDVLISGYSPSFAAITRVYKNTAGNFSDIGASLDGASETCVAWGDYDNDGDLDMVTSGVGNQQYTHLYRNNLATPANTPPSAPTNLQVQVVGTQATLSWSPSTDGQTPAAALSYNLRVGSSPGGSQLVAPMANTSNGYRRIAQTGSTGSNTSWSLSLSSFPITATLYFSVQAIDGAFAGSGFGTEAVFSGAPIIQSVKDVGNDQGRRVRVKWQRSIYDSPQSSTVIASYALWRRVGPYKAGTCSADRIQPPPGIATPPGSWDFVLTVPARSDPTYSVVAPTLCDSTSAGMCRSVFFASAISTNPQVFFDSAPDSGYSVDNLAPSVPQNLVVAQLIPSQVTLGWAPVLDTDRNYYAVYRADMVNFQPGPQSHVGNSVNTAFADPTIATGHRYYYWVAAVDFAGNQSPLSNFVIVSNGTTDTESHAPRFTLEPNSPNPFNPTTEIGFELETAGHARIAVFAPSGKWITNLVDAELPAGVHHAVWTARDAHGEPLPSGAYLCKLTAGAKSATRKMILVR